MAIVRMTLEEASAFRHEVDHTRLAATTDEEIDAMIAADPDLAPDTSDLPPPGEPWKIRRDAGMTQVEFAAMLQIPVETLRDWELRRTEPDATATALFRLMADDLPHALKVLRAA